MRLWFSRQTKSQAARWPQMEHTPQKFLMQFTQLCQLDLFPVLEQETGELSISGKLLAEALSLTQLHRFAHKQWRGRPCQDRRAMIAAFLGNGGTLRAHR